MSRTIIVFFAILASILLSACNNEQTLQKYYVDNSNKNGFIEVDLSSNLINTDKTKLTAEEKKALESFDKVNILAFKADETNKMQYEAESQKLTSILKGKDYSELIKVSSGKDGALMSYVGDENHINEFVLFGKKKDKGFAVVRVLGNDMNPNNIMNMISVLRNSNVELEQLKPLQDLMK